MANKTLNVRIQSKGDSYNNFKTENPVLLLNEIAIVNVAAEDDAIVSKKPATYIKIGNGTSAFNDLPFLAAISGDVYDWAKAESKPSYSATEISGLEDFISGEIQDTNTTYQIVQDSTNTNTYKLQSKEVGQTDWTDVSTFTIPEESEYTIVKTTTPTSGAFATYELQKNGTAVGAKIDIPKDYLVKSASIKTSTGESDPSGFPSGQKYIDFVVNSFDADGNESHIYLNVNDLVDAYTGDETIYINSENKISLNLDPDKMNGLSKTTNGLSLNLATTTAAGAMSSSDKTKLDGLHNIATSGNVNDLEQTEGDILILNCGNATL